MAATDAKPLPQKNVAYRHYFALRDTAGALVTTWAGADSERSIDGAAFADCTNEATEIGTTGCGYIDLTAAEMNADATMLKVTVTNTDALAYVVTFFPEEAGDIRVEDSAILRSTMLQGSDVAIGTVTSQTQFTLTSGPTKDITSGIAVFTDVSDSGNTHTVVIDSYTGSTGVLVVATAPDFTVTTSDTVSVISLPSVPFEAADFADDFLTGAKVASDVAVDLNADQSAVTIGTVTTNTDMRGTDSAATQASLTTVANNVLTIDGNVTDGFTDTQNQITGLNDLSLADIGTALASYDGPTNTEMVAAFTEIKGATWAATDTLEAIRNRGDAAWTTATGFIQVGTAYDYTNNTSAETENVTVSS